MKVPLLFGLKAKFVIITAVLVAAFCLVWGTSAIREERSHLLHNLEDKGRLALSSLRAPIINTIILQEIGSLPQILDNFTEELSRSREMPTAYAYITDANGKVLTHSRLEEFGNVYHDSLTVADLPGGYRQRIIQWEGKPVLEMSIPLRVSGKSWGALGLGLSMEPMERQFRAFRNRILLSSLLFFCTGTAIFYLIGNTMTRPLVRLSRVMSGIDIDALEAEPLPPRRDEIGTLQTAFSEMVIRLKQSEVDRQQAVNHMIQQDKMATIGMIVAGVAHEINNPLAALSASVYSLESRTPPDCLQYLEILKHGIDRIGATVIQLSDFSRVTSIDLEQMYSDRFFAEVETFAAMALKEHILLVIDNCNPPVMLHIDKAKMHQVLLNLLLNAAYASPEGSTIELCATINNDCYTLTVTDHGSGIPAENLDKVFDIFFTTKPAGTGSGIGLAVCKTIVHLHRGTLDVESVPGKTTFTVRIPMTGGAMP